jgi:hypothetical protein
MPSPRKFLLTAEHLFPGSVGFSREADMQILLLQYRRFAHLQVARNAPLLLRCFLG